MKKVLLTIIALGIWTSGYTCECLNHIGNFLKASKWAEVVFIVKVKEHGDFMSFPRGSVDLTSASQDTIRIPQTATFEMIKIIKGNTDKKEIKVFGDNGAQCRPYIDTFEKGKYYIVGLYRSDGKEGNETKEDFFAPGCGEFWIEYHPDSKTVTGRIKDKKRKLTTIPLETLEKLLRES